MNSLRLLLHFIAVTLMMPAIAPAQRALLIVDQDGTHLATNVKGKKYEFFKNGELNKSSIPSTDARLFPVRNWFPGFVKIEKLRGTVYVTGASSSYVIVYKMKVTANRDIKDAFLVYYAETPQGRHMKVACPVGKLKKGKSRSLTHSLPVDSNFVGLSFNPYFMSKGFQLVSSEVDVAFPTPYEKWLEVTPQDEQKSDGPPEAITQIQPADAKDSDGEIIHGKVLMRLEIDEAGYVIEAEAVEPTNGPLVQSVLNVIYLWEFKPKIEKGAPVKCQYEFTLEL